MLIKNVLEYDYNYAEYLITDGLFDLRCMCVSVPLSNGKVPVPGMEVAGIDVFSFTKTIIKKIDSDKEKRYLITKEKGAFEYLLRGEIIDRNKALVKIEGFTLSLNNDFESGFPDGYSEGEYIEFKADRLDVTLRNI